MPSFWAVTKFAVRRGNASFWDLRKSQKFVANAVEFFHPGKFDHGEISPPSLQDQKMVGWPKLFNDGAWSGNCDLENYSRVSWVTS